MHCLNKVHKMTRNGKAVSVQYKLCGLFLSLFHNAFSSAEVMYQNKFVLKMAIIKIWLYKIQISLWPYNFYLKHFSVWCIFN
jgi:hypothetical protein